MGFSHNYWIDVFFACIGMFVVSKIILSNTSKLVKLILATAILFVITGVVLEIIWTINTPFVIIGGVGMILGHLLNYKPHKASLK